MPNVRTRGADTTLDALCPTCDQVITVRLAYGRFDHIEQGCSNNCHLDYCASEYAYLTRVVEDEAAMEGWDDE